MLKDATPAISMAQNQDLRDNKVKQKGPLLCKYCAGVDHIIKECVHLKLEHDAANCSVCLTKSRRNVRKIERGGKCENGTVSAFYSSKAYWERRYDRLDGPDSRNEWFLSYDEHLRPLFEKYLPTKSFLKIVDVGCGVSLLAESLAKDEYGHVTGVDIAQSAISIMEKRKHTLSEAVADSVRYIHVSI